MRLSGRYVGLDAIQEDCLDLVDILSMQINAMKSEASRPVILTEDVLGRLPVVVMHPLRVHLGLVGECLDTSAIVPVAGWGGLGLMITSHNASASGQDISGYTDLEAALRASADRRARWRSLSYSASTLADVSLRLAVAAG